MNLVSYGMYQLSNVLVVLWLPSSREAEFLVPWAISTGLGSFLTLLLMSERGRGFGWLLWACGGVLGLALLAVPSWALWVAFGLAAVVSDYLLSLWAGPGSRAGVRAAHLGATLLFVAGIITLAPLAYLRTGIALLAAILLSVWSSRFERLRLSTPVPYLVLTHGGYYGPLILMSLVQSGFMLRAAYVTYQIAGNLILKALDVSIRGEMPGPPGRWRRLTDLAGASTVLVASGVFGLRVGVLFLSGMLVLVWARQGLRDDP